MIRSIRQMRWLLLVLILSTTSIAQAQYRGPIRPNLNINREAYQRPTVSPYLQLLNNNSNNPINVPQYQTLVRPQIEQQNINRQQTAQIQSLQRRAAATAQGTVAQPAGPTQIRGTGHQTRYQELQHVGRDRTSQSQARRPIFLDYSRFYVGLANRERTGAAAAPPGTFGGF